jgi:Na+-driven multidrug efflux pump
MSSVAIAGAGLVPTAPTHDTGGAPPMNPRTRRLLHGAIVPTLLALAWPNILVMTAQASTGLIETWWVSRLGTDALAGMALVFPGFMMMQMLSAGAIGGGISSAVARALGGGRRDDANALVLHALLVNLALGVLASAIFLAFGRPIYAAMGGRGASLEAALAYSNVVFAGNVLMWLMNALASVIRGTGNMLVPSLAVCIGIVLLVPLSPLFIFGWGPCPASASPAAASPSSSRPRSPRRSWRGTCCRAAASCACGARA